MKALEQTRFDTRLPKEQKTFFEQAAHLGGFRTLTEFVLFSVQEQAKSIIEKHNIILASKKDQEVFFNALLNPPQPNENLTKALMRFNKIIENQ